MQGKGSAQKEHANDKESTGARCIQTLIPYSRCSTKNANLTVLFMSHFKWMLFSNLDFIASWRFITIALHPIKEQAVQASLATLDGVINKAAEPSDPLFPGFKWLPFYMSRFCWGDSVASDSSWGFKWFSQKPECFLTWLCWFGAVTKKEFF